MDSSRFVLPKHPKSFPCKDKRRRTCGMHTLKAVIEWYHIENDFPHMHYASGRFSKNTWYMFPSGLLRVLRKFGLPAQRVHCRRTRKKKKLEFLKAALQKWPVILLISHAYSSKRHFSFRRAFTLQHYISLRGYDDQKRIFYAYDSNTEKKHHTGAPLIGNIVLDYNKLLRYRRLGGWWFFRDFGIAVDYHLTLSENI